MKSKKQNSQKKRERLHRFFQQQREMYSLLKKHGGDILASDNFKKTKEFIQHGNMTVNSHSISVAKHSLALNKKLGLSCNQRELIRGALLHDYFLYDWHDKEHRDIRNLHGFFHPGIALKNASREYRLTAREKDIIKKHMWPLTVVPPLCREAWVVSAADKYCSLMETLKLHQERGKKTKRMSGTARLVHGRLPRGRGILQAGKPRGGLLHGSRLQDGRSRKLPCQV